MPEAQRLTLAARIANMDLDVLCVQEAEDIEALGGDFNRFHLRGLYPQWLCSRATTHASLTLVCSRSCRWAA